MSYFPFIKKKDIPVPPPAKPVGDFGPDYDRDDYVPCVERTINAVIVHCTASDVPEHDRKMREYIWKWHVEENGWKSWGYHFGIKKNGEIVTLRPLNIAGAHCKGHNKATIGIVLSGMNDFSEAQFESLRRLLKEIYKDYNLTSDNVFPHSYFCDKKCPNFDLRRVIC